LGNLLQQFYNIADTLIVGRFLGAKALAAVGSAYTLMIFLTSVGESAERHWLRSSLRRYRGSDSVSIAFTGFRISGFPARICN
jgi:O-antigen/teichoic acid export membrane protein